MNAAANSLSFPAALAAARTAEAARAQRLARRAPRPAVTDEAADAYLPAYDRADEFPALTSRNLARRESRDAYRRDEDGWSQGENHTAGAWIGSNVNEGVYNRAVRPSGVAGAAMDDVTAQSVESLLDALGLAPETHEMLRLRMEGWSLSQIAGVFGTYKQTVDRRIQAVGIKLFAYWLADESCGCESVIRAEANRIIVRSLTNGTPSALSEPCSCGSHQHRAQRVKDQPGVYTYHCTNCKKKRTQQEFESLTGRTRQPVA